LLPLLAAALLFAGGCATEVQKAERTDVRAADHNILVETYPPPVDPALLPAREAEPVPEPKIIAAGEKSTLVYRCRYARSETLREALEGLISPEGTIQATPRLNTLIISDAKDLIPGLLELVQSLDYPVPQLLVEARVIEVTLDSDLEYELRYAYSHPGGTTSAFVQPGNITLNTPGSNPLTTQGILLNARIWTSEDAGQMDAFIRLLLSRGNAKLLSSPNLIVSAGDEASIITGEEVPVQSATVVSGSVSTTTLFKRVGIKLRVIPLQITNDTAMVEINPEVSAVTGYTVAGAGVSNPIVAIRNVNTTLSLKDGEILTIGGLLRSEDRDLVRKVPFLGDIPGVGVLFRSRRSQSVKTQLIFFLRINILGQGKQHGLMYHRPGVGLERLDTQVERTTPRQRELDPMKLPPFEPDSPTPAPENAPAPAPENPAKPAPAGDAEKQAVQAPK
jgi:type II secretory pathway component GspD/PulD (secretin)